MLSSGTPLVRWSVFFVTVGRDSRGLQWPPESWGGAIFFAVLTGLALHLLLNTRGRPGMAADQQKSSAATSTEQM